MTYKKMFFRIVLVLLIITITSCSKSAKNNGDFSDETIKTMIHLTDGKIYSNDSLFLGLPLWLRFHPDSFLIIQEYNTPKLIKIIDLKTNRIQELIPQGKGPGEMLVSWGIHIMGKDLLVFCEQLRKVIRLTANDDRKFEIIDEFKLDVKNSTEFYPVKENLNVCLSGSEDNSRLTFTDGEGKIVKRMGDFPVFQSADNIKADNDIFQSSITGSPNGNKIAVACRRTDVIEIYDLKNDSFKRFQGPLGIKLTVIDQGIAKSLQPGYFTYALLIANDKEFWASYEGKKTPPRGTQLTTEEQLPKQIYCFDWSGRPLRKLILDNPFSGFDIDWGKMILYTLEIRDNYPAIVEYPLKF
jgi:WD40 repeat protein